MLPVCYIPLIQRRGKGEDCMSRTVWSRVVLTLLLPVVLFLSVILLAYRRFAASVQREVEVLKSKAIHPEPQLVTEDLLKDLPAPVQRYLRFSGVVGKPIPSIVHLTQNGKIRRSADEPWMAVQAEEYYSVNPPAFVWDAKVGNGLPLVRGSDHYIDGKGHMKIKMLSLYPLVDAEGEELDQGTFLRYLNEMTWFPAAFLGENVSWKAIDDNSAEVTLTDHGKRVSATMTFDADGRLTDFVADRYYQVDGGKSYEFRRWSTPISGYGEMAGLKLPVSGSAVWKLDDGDFEYIQLDITNVEYFN